MKVVLYNITSCDLDEIVARIGYSSISLFPPEEIKLNKNIINEFFKTSVKYRLGSILDFHHYIFTFYDVSRAFTHQLVRHRIAAYVQQSLRRVKIKTELDEDPWFIIPPSILSKGAKVIIKYIEKQLESGRVYLDLLGKNVPPEDARFVLPIGVKTFITAIMNAEELLHVLKVRTCFDAQWEIRIAFYALMAGLVALTPSIFKYAGPYCVYDGLCRGLSNGVCIREARELTRKIKKIGLQIREKLEKNSLTISLTDILGYKVPEEVKKEVQEYFGKKINLDYEVILEIRRC